MDQLQLWLSQWWDGIVYHYTHMTLTAVLWTGLLLLTVVLLILMSTRWGHAKPIWKCVILSVFAHVLLGGYAYGTKLIFTTPQPEASDFVALKLVDSEALDRESDDEATTQTKPWDQLDLANDAVPQSKIVDRLAPKVQQTIARTQPEIAPEQFQPQVPKEVRGQLTTVPPVHSAPQPFRNASTAHRVESSVADPQQLQVDQRQRRDEASEFNAPSSDSVPSVNRVDSLQNEVMQQSAARSVVTPVAEQGEGQDVGQLLQNLASASGQRNNSEIPDALLKQNQKLDQARSGLKQNSGNQWSNPDSRNGNSQFASAPRRLADGAPMPEIYSGRTEEKRKEKSKRHGGTVETEQAVGRALHWLAANQEADGSWNGVRHGAGQERLVLGHDRKGAGTNADTGITGLSLLAFLASGHSHLEGEYKDNVKRGLEYLLRKQAGNGDMAGEAKLFARMYCHAMASLAITETLAMTGDEQLKPSVQRAVDFSLAAQHPSQGGWRYRPGDEGDMSQFGWQVLLLKSAELGGINIPDANKEKMISFLQRCTSGAYGGLAGYRPGTAPSTAMTAEALLCRHFLYDQISTDATNEASQLLLRELPGFGQENLYYWYYGTLAMFHTGGPAWSTWNHHLTKTLVGSQVREGTLDGSWNPSGVWAGYGGRVYSTAMATLCLEVYYRYELDE